MKNWNRIDKTHKKRLITFLKEYATAYNEMFGNSEPNPIELDRVEIHSFEEACRIHPFVAYYFHELSENMQRYVIGYTTDWVGYFTIIDSNAIDISRSMPTEEVHTRVKQYIIYLNKQVNVTT